MPQLSDADFPPLVTPTGRQQSISLDESRRSTPPVPPGFDTQAANESRRSTPTVPPGLSKPTAIPDLEGTSGSRPSSRGSLRRTTSQITPALPLKPAVPSRPATPSQANVRQEKKDDVEVKSVQTETPTRPPKYAAAPTETAKATKQSEPAVEPTEPAQISVPVRQPFAQLPAVASVPEPAEVTPEPKSQPKQEKAEVIRKSQHTEEKAEASQKSQKPQRQTSKSIQPSAKGQATVQASDRAAAPVSEAKANPGKPDAQKRHLPGKLDIAAATSRDEAVNSSLDTAADANASAKSQRSASLAIAETPKSESPSGDVASPVTKAAPKTIRVVPTPKTEAPAAAIATPKEPTSSTKLPSRKPSVASINLPGTPSSEQVSISDNFSVASTSQSRANSPPPTPSSKAGTTPTKVKTKTQQKKERQERAKAIEEEKGKNEETAKSVQQEPEQDPIVSRKKKAKKEKEPTVRAKAPSKEDPTPTPEQPVSPQIKTLKTPSEVTPKAQPPAKEQKAKPATPIATPIAQPAFQSPYEPSPPPTPTLTASQLLAELKATAPEIQKCIDSLFKSPASYNTKTGQSNSAKGAGNHNNWKQDFQPHLTKAEVTTLLQGRIPAVRYADDNGVHGMVSPSGAHLRALTEELESRFLELEKAIRDLPEELRFRPSKPQNEMKFPSIDLEALQRQFENAGGRGVSVMEQMVQDGSSIKKGAFLVDEASKYINEFVMPPATPPPSAGNGSVRGQAGAGAQGGTGEPVTPSVDIAERQLNEARRLADERDNALKKAIKKNKKLLGMG